MRHLVRFTFLALLLAGAVASAASAGAQSADPPATTPGTIGGPAISLSKTIVYPGQRIDIVFDQWEARLATISVCGNLAKRGSADCNQVNSQTVTLRGIGVEGNLASMVINPPTGACPCVIRAAGQDTREVAITPIEIIDHPTGPIIDPTGGQLVESGIRVERADTGFLGSVRALLGGPVEYDVTVDVRNLSTESLSNVQVFGAVGHSVTENLATYEAKPGPIDANRTWTTTTRVTAPALAIGDYVWQVKASGAGPIAAAQTTDKIVPWLLFVLIALLIGDLVMIVTRWLRRRRERRRALEIPGDEAVLDLTGDDEVVPGARPEYVPIKEDLLSGSR